MRVRCCNVLNKRAQINTIQALNWIVKDGVEYIIDDDGKFVASNGMDEAVGSPRFACRGVLCPEFHALMGGGAGRDNWIQRRFGGWDVKWCSILCKVEGGVLEQSQVALVVSPRAGDSH